jgi:hypothetical protein
MPCPEAPNPHQFDIPELPYMLASPIYNHERLCLLKYAVLYHTEMETNGGVLLAGCKLDCDFMEDGRGLHAAVMMNKKL